jgi:hypothetical protein
MGKVAEQRLVVEVRFVKTGYEQASDRHADRLAANDRPRERRAR